MWANSGAWVDAARPSFFGQVAKTCASLSNNIYSWGDIAGCPGLRVGQLPALCPLRRYCQCILVYLEMEKFHGNQCVELFRRQF